MKKKKYGAVYFTDHFLVTKWVYEPASKRKNMDQGMKHVKI